MAVLKLACPCLTERERAWAYMRQQRVFTRRQLCTALHLDPDGIRNFLRGLTNAGILERADGTYTLIRDSGVDAPRVRRDGTLLPLTGRARMWNAMPVLGEFSAAELAYSASLPDAPVTERDAEKYLGWLTRGGYLVRTRPGRYRCIPARRHGPRAPQIQKLERLFDPNTGEVSAEEITGGKDE